MKPQSALPEAWKLVNLDCFDFEKNERSWDTDFANKCDLAVANIYGLNCDEKDVEKYVVHLGHALKRTGVGHVWCSTSQYDAVQK